MTIQQLQYVVALATHRQFVKAAESCFVTQPTLTLQLKKLEQEISAVLFDRSSHPLKPTPIGEAFIKKARRILQEMEELKAMINEERDSVEGEISVGIIPTLSPHLLPLFIGDFIKRHTNIQLVIEELQSEQIIEMIDNRQLDVGILATPLNEPDIREIPLFYEPFMVFTDEQNELLQRKTIAKEQLRPEGLWILREGHCFRNQTLNICDFEESERHKNVIMEGGSIETLKKVIKEVTGYTLIPELSYDSHNDANHVVHFKDPKPVREVSIVMHKHFTKERVITELRKSILRNIPDNFKKNTRFKTVKWR